MKQNEIAQAAVSWGKEDKDNRAVITILVDNNGNDTVATSINGLDMYVYALSRLFKNSVAARTAAIAALVYVRKEEGNEQ